MITLEDLDSAIAECKGKRNPNANTCMMLAAFLTIRKHLYGDGASEGDGYSLSAAPGARVEYTSDTEFGQVISGRNAEDMWSLMDEVMSTIQIVNPPLYRSVMRRI